MVEQEQSRASPQLLKGSSTRGGGGGKVGDLIPRPCGRRESMHFPPMWPGNKAKVIVYLKLQQ